MHMRVCLHAHMHLPLRCAKPFVQARWDLWAATAEREERSDEEEDDVEERDEGDKGPSQSAEQLGGRGVRARRE